MRTVSSLDLDRSDLQLSPAPQVTTLDSAVPGWAAKAQKAGAGCSVRVSARCQVRCGVINLGVCILLFIHLNPLPFIYLLIELIFLNIKINYLGSIYVASFYLFIHVLLIDISTH